MIETCVFSVLLLAAAGIIWIYPQSISTIRPGEQVDWSRVRREGAGGMAALALALFGVSVLLLRADVPEPVVTVFRIIGSFVGVIVIASRIEIYKRGK